MKQVNVIGPGRVGETLMRCLSLAQTYTVQDVCGRNFESVKATVERVGVGRAAALESAKPAEIWLITVPDGKIAEVASSLAQLTLPPATAIHCSGFHGADVLAPLTERGWKTASAHPNLSFADPEAAANNFAGTLVGIEGTAEAVNTAEDLMQAIGARPFPLRAESKTLYHAAAVISNNFTTVLQAVAQQTWEEAGLRPDVARELSNDLLRTAAENTVAFGPSDALTGPAARGDTGVVQAETEALSAWNAQAGDMYAELSQCAARLKETAKPF